MRGRSITIGVAVAAIAVSPAAARESNALRSAPVAPVAAAPAPVAAPAPAAAPRRTAPSRVRKAVWIRSPRMGIKWSGGTARVVWRTR